MRKISKVTYLGFSLVKAGGYGACSKCGDMADLSSNGRCSDCNLTRM